MGGDWEEPLCPWIGAVSKFVHCQSTPSKPPRRIRCSDGNLTVDGVWHAFAGANQNEGVFSMRRLIAFHFISVVVLLLIVGAWCLLSRVGPCGPFALAPVAFAALGPGLFVHWAITGGRPDAGWGGAISVVTVSYLVWMVPVVLIAHPWRLWNQARGERRQNDGLCAECGYDRRGIVVGAACPECGSK